MSIQHSTFNIQHSKGRAPLGRAIRYNPCQEAWDFRCYPSRKMQNIVLLIIATLFINIQTTKAQNPTAKVQWNVSATQDSTHTKYIITAKATIDKGWHIFAAEPGGDGLLIPTTLEIENNTAVQQETPTHKGEIISEEMEAVGKVNYYKNQYQWQCNVKAKPKTKLKIIIQYQSCNEMMCLPPQTIEKIITL